MSLENQFQRGQVYRLNEDPTDFDAHGQAEHAGEFVRLETFERLHDGTPGAWVTLANDPEARKRWVALQDLRGDNILHDIFCTILTGLAMVWSMPGGIAPPYEQALSGVCYGLVQCHGINPQSVLTWVGTVVEEK